MITRNSRVLAATHNLFYTKSYSPMKKQIFAFWHFFASFITTRNFLHKKNMALAKKLSCFSFRFWSYLIFVDYEPPKSDFLSSKGIQAAWSPFTRFSEKFSVHWPFSGIFIFLNNYSAISDIKSFIRINRSLKVYLYNWLRQFFGKKLRPSKKSRCWIFDCFCFYKFLPFQKLPYEINLGEIETKRLLMSLQFFFFFFRKFSLF